jgi:1-acyl-sn-glycerol-3-phosphate acyltransferase
MRRVRVALRLAAYVLASATFYLLWVAGKGLLSLFRLSKRRWRKFVLRGWARSIAWIIGMRIDVQGEAPQPPFFLVSNHLSYIDIIAYAAVLDCVFISRHDIVDWPGMGRLAQSIGTIFIDRQHFHDIPRVVALIDRTLAEGYGVILFPEGTSTKGDTVLPFKPSLLEPAARAGYPVSFSSISYHTRPGEAPAHMAVCWWGDMTFTPHLLELLKLSRFEALITFGSHAIQADDRKLLAKSLWHAVNEQFVPVVNGSNHEKEV